MSGNQAPGEDSPSLSRVIAVRNGAEDHNQKIRPNENENHPSSAVVLRLHSGCVPGKRRSSGWPGIVLAAGFDAGRNHHAGHDAEQQSLEPGGFDTADICRRARWERRPAQRRGSVFRPELYRRHGQRFASLQRGLLHDLPVGQG